MQKPVTTIFFAPQAAGKTSIIRKMKQADKAFVHFDLDEAVEKFALANMGLGTTSAKGTGDQFLRACIASALKQHLMALQEEFIRGTPHVVVDYATPHADLARLVIKMSHMAGSISYSLLISFLKSVRTTAY